MWSCLVWWRRTRNDTEICQTCGGDVRVMIWWNNYMPAAASLYGRRQRRSWHVIRNVTWGLLSACLLFPMFLQFLPICPGQWQQKHNSFLCCSTSSVDTISPCPWCWDPSFLSCCCCGHNILGSCWWLLFISLWFPWVIIVGAWWMM